MNIQDLPSNSDKSREEKTVEKVTTGNVKVKKRNAFEKAFVNEDTNNIRDYMVYDVLIPTAKDTFYKIISNSISMLLFGEAREPGGRPSSGGSRVSYNSYYDQKHRSESMRYATPRRDRFDLDNIIFDTRDDAEVVLDGLYEHIDKYRVVSVSDFYDLAGLPGDYTYRRYGWTDLGNARAEYTRDGYIIRLPKPRVLD